MDEKRGAGIGEKRVNTIWFASKKMAFQKAQGNKNRQNNMEIVINYKQTLTLRLTHL
jgi:hypothetical protein